MYKPGSSVISSKSSSHTAAGIGSWQHLDTTESRETRLHAPQRPNNYEKIPAQTAQLMLIFTMFGREILLRVVLMDKRETAAYLLEEHFKDEV